MVFKKPYAFLIKHFRLIHVILTILGVFIAVESYRLLSFFTDFVGNNYSATIVENMVSEYISPILYLAIAILVGMLLVMMILLKMKNKPIKTYIIAVLYYIIYVIFIIIASVLIGGLVKHLWSTASARLYRDIALIVYYPQFLVIIILAIRAIGFDVKKFNFKDDLRAMEITAADSEEVEVSLNFDTSKVQRKARRFIRETGYYYQENKFIISVIAIIGVLIIGYTIYKNYEKTIYRYKEGETFTLNGLSLKVRNSIISNTDTKGNIINPDNAYLVLSLEVTNNTTKDIDFKYDYIKLYNGNKYTYPDLTVSNYFIDCGTPLNGTLIKSRTTQSYIIPYIIDMKSINSKFQLGMYIGNAANKKKFVAKKAFVKLKPILYMDNEYIKSINPGVSAYLGNEIMKDVDFKVSNVQVLTRYSYNYESCYKENCRTYTDVVVADPTYLNRQGLIVMDYELSLDKTASSYEMIHNISDFLNAFATIEYGSDSKSMATSTIKDVTPQRLEKKAIIQTSGGIMTASKINLVITIRNKTYKFILKDN